MRTRRRYVHWLAALATVAPAVVVASASPGQAIGPDLLPVTVTNNTGRGEAVYLYILGTDIRSGRLGYVNSAGAFSNWPAGGLPPTPAPDVAIAGPVNGGSVTVRFPRFLSARMYFSFGQKLDFRLTPDGLVQPAPWAGGDPNRDILFDWSEFTYNDAGLWLNSSQVDMFAVPHAVSVTGSDGVTARTGDPVNNGRENVINQIKAQPEFARSVYTRSDGTVLRVLAPGKAMEAGLMNASYLDAYINSAWNAYTSRTLTVVPRVNEPNRRFTGRTVGNNMVFTDGSGAQVASVPKPSTGNVWGCDGVFNSPNTPPFIEPEIKRTLCTALNRGTLGTSSQEPVLDASQFYKNSSPNQYSRIVHANMADGKAYGFAYDDVGGFESLVHSGDPRSAAIILSPFGAGANPSNTLSAGQRLSGGQGLTSSNGRFHLNMQTDGNLVIYDGSSAIWATGTWSLPSDRKPTRADMQADGNLVLYNDANQAAWASGSWGLGRVNPYVEIQDDGNLVIYHNGRTPLWASGTNR
jgi:Beta-1,3-glucanase